MTKVQPPLSLLLFSLSCVIHEWSPFQPGGDEKLKRRATIEDFFLGVQM